MSSQSRHEKCKVQKSTKGGPSILNKYWLEKLQKAHDDAVNSDLNYEDYIATGFNCQQSCGHKTIKTYDNFIVKKTILTNRP